jgi:hypothetical protein
MRNMHLFKTHPMSDYYWISHIVLRMSETVVDHLTSLGALNESNVLLHFMLMCHCLLVFAKLTYTIVLIQ